MKRSELIDELYSHSDFTHDTVVDAVDCILNTLSGSLALGQRIEIRGFGSFKIKERPARLARNPKIGATVPIPQKVKVAFKPSSLLCARLNSQSD